MAVAVVASSCQKDLGGSPDSPVVPGAVPADFDWKTTRNVTVSVSAPVVEGATPPYAVIRIYSSPILSAENLAARGVAKSAMPFRSAFTLPAGTENLYVQTTLPDGTKSVKMVGAHGTVAVTGASMKAAAAPKMRLAANARVGSSMPDYPKMEAPDAASFDSKAVITAIESGKSYQLGASWAFYAAPEYLIPAGAEVAGELDLNGGFSPYQAPILYVAGKLTLSSLNIGRAKLAVLPGGEVKIGTLKIQPSAADGAAVYVFADGKLSVGKPNVSGKCIVNNGTLTVDGSLDMNSGLTVYNTATGVLTVTDEMKVSNSARIYNDGAVTVDDLKINSDGEFHNCENALLVVNDECELERSTAIYQRGRASIEEMTARGTIWVNCHTSVNELEAQGAEFNFSANAGLDAGRVEFNNTNVSMARGAIFTMEEYNADEKGGGNRFAFTGDADPRAVVLISEKAYIRKGHETYFSGAIEVVYDNDRDKDYTIRKDYLTDGAVMSASQTTIIAENGCNGGKDPVNPDPEPEPDEYANVPGRTYTYCFEDNWPWLGDYDMNDVVIVSRIDRDSVLQQDGGAVECLEHLEGTARRRNPETHHDGDLLAAGGHRLGTGFGDEFLHRAEAAHQRDSHAGLCADRFGDYRQGFVPAFGSLQVLRDGGRPDQEQLHDVGADDSGRVPLPCRDERHPRRLRILHGMGLVQRRGARGVVSGERRCRQDLLRKRPVMGRGCERFAAFFASGRCRRTEGCAGIEDGRAVRGFRRPGDRRL